MLVATLFASILAVGLAFFSEYMDNKIKSPDEVHQHLGLPCLGLVPQAVEPKLVDRWPLIPTGVSTPFVESVRKLRSNVLFAAAEDQRTLAITSTGPNEGKTVVAANLAVGLAMTSQRVLLIDADMRRSRLHDLLSMRKGPGLSEYLRDTASWKEVVQRYDDPIASSLDLITAGEDPPNPSELLSSLRFREMLAKAGGEYDWVIIDSPPALAVTDASILAHEASAVLFVVGAEINRLPNVLQALEQLDTANPRFLGVVLNRARIDRNAFYYSNYVRQEYSSYYAAGGRANEATNRAALGSSSSRLS
jgi:capsular exopolysaccharide synthesis family protein